MSKTTKSKYVRREVLCDYVLPDENEQIVKIKCSRGNNLHEVETADGETFLVSMPSKYRKVIWVKRGDFVIVRPIEEGFKIKAEIIHILYKDQIKYIKEEGRWPSAFDTEKRTIQDRDEDGLFVNTNRQIVELEEEEETESSDEEM